MKCVVCDKETEYVFEGTSLCDIHLMQDTDVSLKIRRARFQVKKRIEKWEDNSTKAPLLED